MGCFSSKYNINYEIKYIEKHCFNSKKLYTKQININQKEKRESILQKNITKSNYI